MTRRELLQSAGFILAAHGLDGEPVPAAPAVSAYDWIRSTRILICEAYNPPFYPALDYNAEKAVNIARELNADSMRYPAASYFAYFPTKSGYPVHPELKGDPLRDTLGLCRKAGLKAVAYVPLNHPFMDTKSKDPRYAGWSKKFSDGRPMTTEHYGYAEYFEGCLNSPVRDVIKALVREVLDYDIDVMYFDGPYQGMMNAKNYCHCQYCEAAYRAKFGKPVPNQEGKISREDEIQYTSWMARDVAIAFLSEIREMIRRTRDVPVLFNDTSLLSRREWRNRAIPVVDGFMFEAAETPEDKLFNMQLGQSTGKVTWTYVGTHTQYNREHLKDDRVRGWYSYPVESEELLIDGATAITAGVGLVYWGVSRFFYQPESPLAYDSGRYVKEIFDFQQKHDALLRSVRSRPQAGIVVGAQTVDWYSGKHFVGKAYENAAHGAYQVLKANGFESEPFLDWQMSPETLAHYEMVYAPDSVCLSDRQCAMLSDYVRNGGKLLATHLTSVADEYGRVRKNFGLAELFGAEFVSPEPEEIPDLYLKFPNGPEIPQDPQVFRFRATSASVLAETIDRGHRANLGPAIVKRNHGKGEVIYIGSSLEAVYEETRMKVLRSFLGGLVTPWLAARRSYEIEYQPGLMPHLMASDNVLLLHLLADTGNKNKHLRIREEFLPVTDVKLRIRVPQGRTVRSVSLLRNGAALPRTVSAGWLNVTVPRVFIHEAVKVELA
ncbi:MAG TPA: beta-galactosidase trimerization domain-containing protein [Bryobacteraceae bacterium]|nr:beta-galactosidase trimerization domain-containing protein [Bryobacteraceae bacterium]